MMPFALQQCQLLIDLPPIVHRVHSFTPVLVTWRVALREEAYGSARAATALYDVTGWPRSSMRG